MSISETASGAGSVAVTGTATGDNSKVDADGASHSLFLAARGLPCASI